jgi:hypothetical protein
MAVLPALGRVAVLVALFATPHGAQLAAHVQLSSLPSSPEVFEVTARSANVEIAVVANGALQLDLKTQSGHVLRNRQPLPR